MSEKLFMLVNDNNAGVFSVITPCLFDLFIYCLSECDVKQMNS